MGYANLEWTNAEAIYDEPFDVSDNSVYEETALFSRVRLGPKVAVELLAAVRLGVFTNGGGFMSSAFASLGLHITM